jgi:50S ribosomal protein L16 3-hydroxylase
LLFERAALPDDLPQLDAGEIAWLATQGDVESRLVITEREPSAVRYRVENGPFDDARLGALPGQDWTLLVQDVEKHLPEFRRWFDICSFLPEWRLDDLMISLAAPGGSVGPHLDSYDVFLCQVTGSREWRIAPPGKVTPDRTAGELSLLEPFAARDTFMATAGDVLYLPPGVPHWGIAEDLCTTYSIGFRAPSKAELRVTAEDLLPDVEFTTPLDEADSSDFYRDPDLGLAEADGGRLSAESIRRLREQALIDRPLEDERLALILGATVTEPKVWLEPEPLSAPEAERVCASPADRYIHGMALLAWFEAGEHLLVFANGQAIETSSEYAPYLRSICRERVSETSRQTALCRQPRGRDLFLWLARRGVFDVG